MNDDNESCSSKSVDSSPKQRVDPRKLQVFNEVLRRIKESDDEEAQNPGFDDQLWLHFNRLPVKYAVEVNVERAEDVLTHKRLLSLAEDPANRPAFEVRPVQVPPNDENSDDAVHSDSPNDDEEDEENSANYSGRQGIHPPPTFGSSSNLEGLAHANNDQIEKGESSEHSASYLSRPTFEITFSSIDRPKLLNQLTSLLAEVDLNIREAHVYCTADGFSLDAFVVDSERYQETKELKDALKDEISMMEDRVTLRQYSSPSPSVGRNFQTETVSSAEDVDISTDGTDDWEVNSRQLTLEEKFATGSLGDLYKGTYCSQEVAIKLLKPERVNSDKLKEFAQEIFIMRKVRHKNIVQFIGACTQPPNMCIVTEFMSKGSLYDFLHKRNGAFKLPDLIKVAIDVSKGMNYLHQNNIIHRDLKTANLLMDENEVVKVADFGVARFQKQSGEMTAETGTYRWMAPEVIEHKPYDHKADVFSFGILLWELLTGELPYAQLNPVQAAIGVVKKAIRPPIPKNTLPTLAELIETCWNQEPSLRPNFSDILKTLQEIAQEVGEDQSSNWFQSVLKRMDSKHQ